MRTRDRFIESIDENKEKLLTQRIKDFRKQIKISYKNLYDTCAIIEPCNFMLIWGALQRCLICIESCVSLISNGYVGSANALLRQIYEFLIWAKAGISSDVATIKKLNAAFYKDDLLHRVTATDILKATKINVEGLPYNEATLKERGKELYHGYSLLTHASNISQQAPYNNQENFYILLNSCLSEVSLLFDVFLLVFSQYIEILDTPFLDTNKLSEKEQGYLWVARVHAGETKYRIQLYHKNLNENQDFHNTFLYIAFKMQWTIDINKLK